MAHEMELAIAVSRFSDDIERVADEPVNSIIAEIGRVGARVGRIATLVRRHDEVTRRSEHRDLVVPEISGDTEPMQH